MLMKAQTFFSVFSDHDQKHFLISGSHIRTSEFNASFYMVSIYVSISLIFRICTCLKSAQGWKWNFHVIIELCNRRIQILCQFVEIYMLVEARIISAIPRNTCCEVKEKKKARGDLLTSAGTHSCSCHCLAEAVLGASSGCYLWAQLYCRCSWFGKVQSLATGSVFCFFFLNKLGTFARCRSPLLHWQVESCGSELWG